MNHECVDELMKNLLMKRGRLPKGLKRLYKKDPLNKTNFHQYIDNNEDILMVVLLKNSYVVGGYSCEPINSGANSGTGFIYSLSQ